MRTAAAFARCDASFHSGCHHGVIQAYFDGGLTTVDRSALGCSPPPRTTIWGRVRASDGDDVRLAREGFVAVATMTTGQVRPAHGAPRCRHGADAGWIVPLASGRGGCRAGATPADPSGSEGW